MPDQLGAAVTRHGREVASVFDLLGQDENDLTAALGFTLSCSQLLLQAFADRVFPGAVIGTVNVRMETRDELGRTDLELDTGMELAVVEAKRGWLLPGESQLSAYAPRILRRGSGVLVSLSNASAEWANALLPPAIGKVPLKHIAWSHIRDDLVVARNNSRGRERFWLDELHEYLKRAIRMRDAADSWVYCVVVSTWRPGDGGLRTFRDFVVNEHTYFHPFGWGGGWPKTPPNFLAFRWNNQVQQVHRVLSSQVMPNLQNRWTDIPVTEDTARPHIVYQLGPALPGMPIPSGRQYRATRLWVLLDMLLTSGSLAEAVERSYALTG